jgi:hypothetical protein|tara:strand:+ start:105 stop:278 length:174 start_codon:yes stop_codon:yes gene_type:complete
MHKEKVDELDRRWINSIIDGLPESEIRQYKTEYIKALEEYLDSRKSGNGPSVVCQRK